MADLSSLLSRIEAQVATARQQAQLTMQDAEAAYERRRIGYEKFLVVVDRIRELAKPRLQALAEHFKFDANPMQNEHKQGVELAFQTAMATVKLKLTASHDTDVEKLIVDYDLQILPIFIKFEPHARFETSLTAVDEAAFEAWLDDRLVDFTKTYLEIHSNSYYQKDHLTTDPVAQIQFPKIYAQATLEQNGKKLYFISEKTRDEFVQQDATKLA